MLRLARTLCAWGSPEFADIAKLEIAQHATQLGLQQGLVFGNYVLDAPIAVVIHSFAERDAYVSIRAGIFFQSVISGCSCADDPTPLSDINEYGEIQLDMDKVSASTQVTWLD